MSPVPSCRPLRGSPGSRLDGYNSTRTDKLDYRRRFGFSIPVRVRFGPFKAYFISSAEHFDVILKGARNLNSTPGLNLVLQTFFGLPKHVVPFYEADNSGISPAPIAGTNVPPHHRINHLRFSAAQKYLYGPHLEGMTKRFVEKLGSLIVEDEAIKSDWTEIPDLTNFLQKMIFRAATTSLCGPHLLQLNPTFIDDFWEYIRDIPVLYKGFPRWLNPKAHRARDRCLAAIKKWHIYAWEHTDRSQDDDNISWEQYFGARIMRTRYTYARKMDATSDESRAAEDLAMIFALSQTLFRPLSVTNHMNFPVQTRTPFPQLYISSSSSFRTLPFSSAPGPIYRPPASTADHHSLTLQNYASRLSCSPSTPRRYASASPSS